MGLGLRVSVCLAIETFLTAWVLRFRISSWRCRRKERCKSQASGKSQARRSSETFAPSGQKKCSCTPDTRSRHGPADFERWRQCAHRLHLKDPRTPQFNEIHLKSCGQLVPFRGPFFKGAVLYWGPERDPSLENYPYGGASNLSNPKTRTLGQRARPARSTPPPQNEGIHLTSRPAEIQAYSFNGSEFGV